MNSKIIQNKIKCKNCGDVIESFSVHDFKFCRCGYIAIDGGKDYLRRCGNPESFEDLSVVEFEAKCNHSLNGDLPILVEGEVYMIQRSGDKFAVYHNEEIVVELNQEAFGRYF